MALLAALEARVPILHPKWRHSIRLMMIDGEDRLVVQIGTGPEIVLEDADFKDVPDTLAAAIADFIARAKEAKRLIEEEGGKA